MPEYVTPGPNSQRSLFAGTATATQTAGPFANLNSRSAIFTLNITAASGTTPTLDVKVQGVNHDGVAYDMAGAAFAQKTAAGGPFVLQIGQGLTAAANVIVLGLMPVQFQVVQTIGGTTPSFTYSLDVDLL
jgi:hypothetical protein